MKLAVFNHVHPAAPHVAALRMREFANALAACGDRIVLVTGTLSPDEAGDDPGGVEQQLADHDWSRPLHLACRPVGGRVRRAAREGKIPPPFRQLVIGGAYLAANGVFADWRMSAVKLQTVLARVFRPDFTFGTFGNTDTWMSARDLAREAGCDWIADYKDPWDKFVPPGLRSIVARRFSDMAAMTTFSETHMQDAATWFDGEKHVLYSGYIEDACQSLRGARDGGLHVCLTGSIYREDAVASLVEGLARIAQDRQVTLSYAGNDGARLRRLPDGIPFQDHGYLDAGALLDLQKTADVNAYIRNPDSLFQQKLIELLAVGRPVLAVPGESAEAVSIASRVGARLLNAETPAEIAGELTAFDVAGSPAAAPAEMAFYSWASQAERLRTLLASLSGGAG